MSGPFYPFVLAFEEKLHKHKAMQTCRVVPEGDRVFPLDVFKEAQTHFLSGKSIHADGQTPAVTSSVYT
jgi:hypothetical protein